MPAAAAFAPNGRGLASGSAVKAVRLWAEGDKRRSA